VSSDDLVPEPYRTGIGSIGAGHDFDQGRLAGTVLAKQCVDFAGMKLNKVSSPSEKYHGARIARIFSRARRGVIGRK